MKGRGYKLEKRYKKLEKSSKKLLQWPSRRRKWCPSPVEMDRSNLIPDAFWKLNLHCR